MGFILIAVAAASLGFARADSAHQRVWTTAPAQLARVAWHSPTAYDRRALIQRVPRWRQARVVDDLFFNGLVSPAPAQTDIVARKRRFLAVMVPATLLVNQLLDAERTRLEAIAAKWRRGRAFNAHERAWFDRIAARYGGADLGDADRLSLLKRRIGAVPPSLVLAQAAIESGWGRSRFAREGNALFGQYRWDGEGMLPADRPAGARHRIQRFDAPALAILGYMHNLNTHPAYRDFRAERARAWAQDAPPDPFALAATLGRYSTLGEEYVKQVQQVIRQNALTDFDRAHLMAGTLRRWRL